ncbi:NTP transferase domain-containing protein [Parafrigoribacterium humi]|uniref:NTP transferase domain-containing protein n=1 Tax=Parafrigoribacterium humi TaxID=3144664 RepID=UPI0032EADE9B
MLIDALVLAGGRSTRLGSVPKARLSYRTRTLLENTVAALSAVRTTVVVGDVTAQSLPAEVLVTREEPAFAGPAAAIGAGLKRLGATGTEPAAVTVVLACDMPGVGAALPLLLDRARETEALRDGLIAVDSAGRLQPLLAAYRTESLTAAVAAQRERGTLEGLSVFHLIRPLDLREIVVPDEASADVDTWADAARWGIENPAIETTSHSPTQTTAKEQKMTNNEQGTQNAQRAREDEELRQWCAKVAEATGVPELEVDLKTVLGLAGRAAHAVMRPAAPLTTFIVGYAAGIAAGSGKATPAEAFTAAADAGFQLAREAMNSASTDA